MILKEIKSLFTRDLERLRQEILLYKSEEIIWANTATVPNSAGNLCLHIIGNLNHFLGHALGNTGYTRNRPLEFSQKHIPRNEIAAQLNQTSETVQKVLDNLYAGDLEKTFPIIVFEKEESIGFMLMHLTTHLSYHLGQVNYHRRLLDV